MNTIGIDDRVDVVALAAAIDAAPVRTFRDGTSFPFLAIARRFNVPYAKVLAYADMSPHLDAIEPWEIATGRAARWELERRIVF